MRLSRGEGSRWDNSAYSPFATKLPHGGFGSAANRKKQKHRCVPGPNALLSPPLLAIQDFYVADGYFNEAKPGVKKAGFINFCFIAFEGVIGPGFGVIFMFCAESVAFFQRFGKKRIVGVFSAADANDLPRGAFYLQAPPAGNILS
jgi:hypothetical protein